MPGFQLDELTFHFPNHQMTRTTDEGGGLEAKKKSKSVKQTNYIMQTANVEQKLFGHMNSIPFAS